MTYQCSIRCIFKHYGSSEEATVTSSMISSGSPHISLMMMNKDSNFCVSWHYRNCHYMERLIPWVSPNRPISHNYGGNWENIKTSSFRMEPRGGFFCCIRRAVPECIELLRLYHRQDTNCWGCLSLWKALEQMSLLQTVEMYVKGSRCVTWRYLNPDRTKPWETWSALKRGLANNLSYSFKPKLFYDSTRFILKTNSPFVIICIQFRSFQLNMSTSW